MDSSSSGPSSGVLYVPSSGVLRRARDTIDRTGELLGSTRFLLRIRMTKPHTEPQPIQHSEHPGNQQHTETPEHQQITENPENQQPLSEYNNLSVDTHTQNHPYTSTPIRNTPTGQQTYKNIDTQSVQLPFSPSIYKPGHAFRTNS